MSNSTHYLPFSLLANPTTGMEQVVTSVDHGSCYLAAIFVNEVHHNAIDNYAHRIAGIVTRYAAAQYIWQSYISPVQIREWNEQYESTNPHYIDEYLLILY